MRDVGWYLDQYLLAVKTATEARRSRDPNQVHRVRAAVYSRKLLIAHVTLHGYKLPILKQQSSEGTAK